MEFLRRIYRTCSRSAGLVQQRLLSILFLSVFLVFYYYHSAINDLSTSSFSKETVSRSTKTILIWNAHDRFELKVFGEGRIGPQHNCPIDDCFITENRSWTSVENFDAILFNMPPLSIHKFPLNEPRRPEQRYVFFSQEPPVYIGEEVSKFDHLFNWTMSCNLISSFKNEFVIKITLII